MSKFTPISTKEQTSTLQTLLTSWGTSKGCPCSRVVSPWQNIALLGEVCSASWGLERTRTKTAVTALKCQSAPELSLGGVMTNPSIHLTSPGATCELVTALLEMVMDLIYTWGEGSVQPQLFSEWSFITHFSKPQEWSWNSEKSGKQQWPFLHPNKRIHTHNFPPEFISSQCHSKYEITWFTLLHWHKADSKYTSALQMWEHWTLGCYNTQGITSPLQSLQSVESPSITSCTLALASQASSLAGWWETWS